MRLLPLLAGVLALSFGGSALAQPAADLKAQCSSCHALAAAAPSVERLWSRKGPDLWYAGAKFNRDWLVKWLQKPTTIRPGGVMWFNHAKPGEPRDTLDTASLPDPPGGGASDRRQAGGRADGAEGRRHRDPRGSPKGEGANLAMGKLALGGNCRGCVACHQDKSGEGGVSGPQLYDAGDRLQPDYVQAYMKDPQAFDRFGLDAAVGPVRPELQRITAYITTLKAGK